MSEKVDPFVDKKLKEVIDKNKWGFDADTFKAFQPQDHDDLIKIIVSII